VSALVDRAARARALTDHASTLLVEAGAGTGKTALMAGRAVLLFARGVAPRHVAVITFTELAASELLARIAHYMDELLAGRVPAGLEEALPGGPDAGARERLGHARAHLDELTCTTIHGFCYALIRPYPVEADLDPGARMTDEEEAELVFQNVREDWLRDRMEHPREGDDPIADLVRHDPDRAVNTLAALAEACRRHRTARPPGSTLEAGAHRDLSEAVAAFRTWYEETPGEERTLEYLQGFEVLADFFERGLQGGRFADRLALTAPPRVPAMKANSRDFRKYQRKGAWQKAAGAEGEALDAEARAHYQNIEHAFAALLADIGADLVARLLAELDELRDAYAEAKRAAALLDFDDLLHKARALLRAHEPVRRALAARFRHVLVDEFQDTDPVQAEILFLLAGEGAHDTPWHRRRLEPGRLFLVGDPKQSIYRFRGADVNAYLRVRETVRGRFPGHVLEIAANFRSVPPVIDYVNRRFAPLLADPGQPGFQRLAATVDRTPHDLPAVAALDIADEHDQKPKSDALRQAEAERVADACARLVGTLAVRGETNEPRPCQPGDIALLAPTGTSLWLYERALEERGIPIATQAGKGLYRRQEVHDLIALARTLADPRDTLAFGALMRGPLVGLTEEQLLDIVEELMRTEGDDPLPRFRLWTDPEKIIQPVAAEVLRILQSLAKRARTTTPEQLLAEAVEALHVRPLLAARHRRGTERALANVDRFLEKSRPYAVRGLQAFARDLTRSWEAHDPEVEGRPDAAEEAVRVITVHSAKGLEWPVVIPINTATIPGPRHEYLYERGREFLHVRIAGLEPAGWAEALEQEKAEAARERTRLWYVALTRARDLLIIPRTQHAEPRSWVGEITLGLQNLPALDLQHWPGAPVEPEAPPDNRQTREIYIKECERIEAATPNITWRRPSRHDADTPDTLQTRAPEWDDVVDTPTPTIQGGAVRGLVLHKLLEEILTGETRDQSEILTRRAAELIRQLGHEPALRPEEGPCPEELAETAGRALAMPEVAAVCVRLVPELPILGAETQPPAEQEETLVAGAADAVALAPDGTPELVIDWKSDVAPDAATRARYREQLRTYLRATGAPKGLAVYPTIAATDSVED